MALPSKTLNESVDFGRLEARLQGGQALRYEPEQAWARPIQAARILLALGLLKWG